MVWIWVLRVRTSPPKERTAEKLKISAKKDRQIQVLPNPNNSHLAIYVHRLVQMIAKSSDIKKS